MYEGKKRRTLSTQGVDYHLLMKATVFICLD